MERCIRIEIIVVTSGEQFEKTLYPNFSSAQVKDGGLVCEPADPSLLSEYPVEGIYHRDDYSLFYENMKENIKERINTYFSQKNSD